MNAVLEAARAERHALLAPIAEQLAALDEIERIAASLNGGGSDMAPTPAPAPAVVPRPPSKPQAPRPRKSSSPTKVLPAKAQATGVGRDGLGATAQAALEKVRAAGATPISRADAGASAHVMQALVNRGLIEATGATKSRRYRAVYDDNGTGGSTASLTPSPPQPRSSNATLGTPDAKASKILRARILDHLSRRRMNEQSLADHLNADREHVVDILGKLLLDELVDLAPDGQYSVPA